MSTRVLTRVTFARDVQGHDRLENVAQSVGNILSAVMEELGSYRLLPG